MMTRIVSDPCPVLNLCANRWSSLPGLGLRCASALTPAAISRIGKIAKIRFIYRLLSRYGFAALPPLIGKNSRIFNGKKVSGGKTGDLPGLFTEFFDRNVEMGCVHNPFTLELDPNAVASGAREAQIELNLG